ncbi:MAG: lipoprotein signal peptidase, partial [Pseudomonadota bacterium]
MRKWLLLSLLVIVLDVYTKHLVQQFFQYGEHLPVTSFFDLVRFHNEGAAFSFLAAQGGWQRTFFSVLALVASVVMM